MQKCHIRQRWFYTKRINYGDFGMFRSREDPHRLATEKQETESNTKKSNTHPPSAPHVEWTPSRYLSAPQPPPLEANARQFADGKPLKKTRPRRTVDYNGGLGRWTLLRKLRPNRGYVPYLRPSPPYIIDLLPPKAYPDNSSTSLCTKFVHTSTNKVRCPVNVVTWTPEGRRVLTGSTSGEFTLWNGLTFNFETILQAHDTAICALTFTHSGAYLASADKSGTIKYFEPNMNNLAAWQGSTSHEAIRGLSFSPDDRRFATASDDSSVRIWSFQERRVESILSGHGWDVKCVEWHPTKGLLVSGSKDNDIKFWDPRTELHQHKNTIQALSWSPNGDMVASASRDQTVRVFDIRAMKEFRTFKGHKKEVCSVTWHPVHPILVSGGSEGAILHWDLGTPEPTFTQPASLPRATLSQHTTRTASNDHTTRFWSRERPGDATSVFSGGGEKPPEVADQGGQDDEEDVMAPGFGGGGGSAAWWSREDETRVGGGTDAFGRSARGYDGGAGDDFIPGFGASEHRDVASRQSGSLPSQDDMYPQEDSWSHNNSGRSNGGDDWNNRGGGGRQSRWGPRNNRGGGGGGGGVRY
ncbi:WD40-repeat-containing domain protein [Mycena leptocephala]|nr:WD40-repeat-containing domain protein [Mycena leptocephala]